MTNGNGSGPPQGDLDSIEQWADDNGLDPEAIIKLSGRGLMVLDGWRDAEHPTLTDAFNYVEDGGIEALALFVWDDIEGRWFVFVTNSTGEAN